MDIHKPKPWQGWPEFLKEIGTIVIGVLIALGAEQAVEWLHWRHEMHLARDALVFDYRRVIGFAAREDAASPCLAALLARYSDALDQAQATKRLPPIGYGGTPLFPPWALRSWTGLTSGQALAHMPNHDQIAISGIPGTLEWARALRDQQANDWAILTTMIGPGRPTSDAEIANLRAALGRSAGEARGQRGLGGQLEAIILRSGFLSRAQAAAAYSEGVAFARTTPICGDLEAPGADPHAALMRGLTGPPTPPDQASVGAAGVGVGGAITTER
jgi:hypothetical protein